MTCIRWLLISTAALLAGCAAPLLDEGSPGYRIPLGSAVVLQQELTIPAGYARVFLQGGGGGGKASPQSLSAPLQLRAARGE